MAPRPLALLLLTLGLCGGLHAASWRWRRDDLTGFPEVPPPQGAAEGDVSDNDVGDISNYPAEYPQQQEQEEGPPPISQDRLDQELEDYHCNPLESLFEELVNSTGLDELLKAMAAAADERGPREPGTADQLFAMIHAKTGFDLRKHDDRHRLACQIQGIKSINDLAALTGMPPALLNIYYSNAMDEFRQVGGVRTIKALVQLMVQYNEWLAETGFPAMPLKVPVDMDDIMERFKRWQTLLLNLDFKGEKGVVHLIDMMRSGIFPGNKLPQYIALVLKHSVSTEDVLDRLCISPEAYERVKPLLKPDILKGINEVVIIMYRIVEAMHNLGLFDLKLEA